MGSGGGDVSKVRSLGKRELFQGKVPSPVAESAPSNAADAWVDGHHGNDRGILMPAAAHATRRYRQSCERPYGWLPQWGLLLNHPFWIFFEKFLF